MRLRRFLLLLAVYGSITAPAVQADSFNVALVNTPGTLFSPSLNDAGEVSGSYGTQSGAVHGFLWAAGQTTTIDPQAPCNSNVNPDDCYTPISFNNHGQIVARQNSESFLYTNGKWQTITGPTGVATGVNAVGLNNSGIVLADQQLPSATNVTFTSHNGVDSVIAPPAGSSSIYGQFINDAGQVAGIKYPGASSFLLTNSQFASVDYPKSTSSALNGLANNGQVWGAFGPPGASVDRGVYVYKNGFFSALNPPGSLGSETVYAFGSDPNGDVYGQFSAKGNQAISGFVYRNGAYQILDFPGARNTEVIAANPSGEVLGLYSDPELGFAHTFLYTNGVYQALNFGPSTDYTIAVSLNNAGQILGYYAPQPYDDPVADQYFVATPSAASTPEPASLALLLLGIGILAHRARQSANS